VTLEQTTAFAIIAGMMVLFIWDKIRYDLTALLGLLAAMAASIVPVYKAFGGFSDQVVIIVGAALIISAVSASPESSGGSFGTQNRTCAPPARRSSC
jgi:Citrate transporter